MPWSLRLSSDIDYIIALRRRARIIGHDTKHREQNPCRLSSDFYDYSRTSYVAAANSGCHWILHHQEQPYVA